MSEVPNNLSPPADLEARTFSTDFRRFFVRGLSTILPTLITLWLIVWVWNFLWAYLGEYTVYLISLAWENAYHPKTVGPYKPGSYLSLRLQPWMVQLIGVTAAVIAVYVLGMFVGHFLGRTAYRLIEVAVMRIPFVRAIYPAVQQVTDFVLADRKDHFAESRVVAVKAHEDNIWSIGLVTGSLKSLADVIGEEMVTVFVPSSPTSLSGYVLVVPRSRLIDLPLSVEEAMRLLVTGGVISPEQTARLKQELLKRRQAKDEVPVLEETAGSST